MNAITASAEFSRLVGTLQKRLPDTMESAERKQQKSSRRYDKTIPSCGQICWTISIAITGYYGRARSLRCPTIETGGAPGNAMTHKSRWGFLAAEGPASASESLPFVLGDFFSATNNTTDYY